ncbi:MULTISPECIES: 50S ribosomal protein L13 [Peptoniphilus]|uniref:Large ribosomal subunit protein uL13 n=1 Tax=Peptoniphilus harei TaxID=54005 RepID=A0A943SQT0_9FIRM|nr:MULTISPECIES: 50S ribosomal protein L13 [Peptoniphilus]MBS6535431.1 50S ribosomal protein L13 [Peptoniphilus harei]MDU1177483.1 50S ribosomal protein L13 [Peptoniphilus harei]MDU1642417.1 50S ribosomal protein L13 [Peptoniphilus harei]MDU3087732.1 50S ribosomal protein L13 [Peptoniphilus harei]MDU5417064.1 50S ribosomal protein L13 [Peptoniphilus harei]
MKSYMAKANEVERKWYVIDAEGKVLGRLASEIASVLRGKRKPIFTPHVDCGDFVIVINADKVVLTGNKLHQKIHAYHTGYPGGRKEVSYAEMMEKRPEKVIELAVKGMLPKNRLGRKMIKKLKVYTGNEHPHAAQAPEVYEF